MNKYTADEAAERLKELGYNDISKRTINYYAFEKNMFEIKERGKGIFTDEEIEKLAGIKLLKTHTNYTLEQIKNIINLHDLEEIKRLCAQRVESLNVNLSYVGEKSSVLYNNSIDNCQSSKASLSSKDRTIKVDSDVTLIVNESMDRNKLIKIIDFIKNI